MLHERAQPPHDPDHLLATAAEAVAERARSPFDRAVLRAAGWFAEHTTVRLVTVVSLLALALVPGIWLLLDPRLVSHRLEGFGYLSVFATNLASTSTVFIPVPGLTATGQALIIREGETAAQPWIVGVIGGFGMGLGEVTLYYAGLLGAELARGRELPGPQWVQRAMNAIAHWVRWLLDRWGMPTLFVLSAIPNPFFEVAGLSAGSVRMSFRRFFIAAVAGKILRGILLAYLGHAVPFL